MDGDPQTVNVQVVDENTPDDFAQRIRREAEVLQNLIREGEELVLPHLRVFSDNTLVVEITLKPHNDEPSYRNALQEAAICLPILAATHATLWYKTEDNQYGLFHVGFASGMGGCFLTEEGESINEDDFNMGNVDTETAIVLEKFVKTPSDATYANEAVTTLRRRGHVVRVHHDLDELFKLGM